VGWFFFCEAFKAIRNMGNPEGKIGICLSAYFERAEVLCTSLSQNQSNFHVAFGLCHGRGFRGVFHFALAASLMAIIIKSVSKQELVLGLGGEFP